MDSFIHSPLGGFHVTASLLSMILGTYILLSTKGTGKHKIAGYLYSSTMLATNLSAFGLYGLFGTFGPFHFAALFSLVTLVMGILPVIFRKRKSWLHHHMYWMHYSVFGLYAAFVSEVVTRLSLPLPFFWSVGIGTTLVMVSAGFIIRRKIDDWVREAKENMKINIQKNKPLNTLN